MSIFSGKASEAKKHRKMPGQNNSNAAANNHANQGNPNNAAYHSSRGHSAATQSHTQANASNHANQMNPNNAANHSSRR